MKGKTAGVPTAEKSKIFVVEGSVTDFQVVHNKSVNMKQSVCRMIMCTRVLTHIRLYWLDKHQERTVYFLSFLSRFLNSFLEAEHLKLFSVFNSLF